MHKDGPKAETASESDSCSSEHYLKEELYRLVREDASIFDFIEKGSLDGIWYWDLENPEVEWMSDRFWEVLGYDPEEMPHRAEAWKEIIHPEDLAVAMDNFRKHCEDPEHPYDQLARYTHRNGSTVWVRCRGQAILDEKGKPVRMLGAHTDLTELVQKERLLERNRYFEGMIQASPCGMLVVDGDGKVVNANAQICDLFGWTEDELLGKGVEVLVPEAARGAHQGHREEFQKDPQRRTMGMGRELQGKRKDGTLFNVEVGLSPFRAADGERFVIASVVDATERVRARSEVERVNKKLSEANDALSQFGYTASHDLREPLRSISGFMELLKMDYSDALDETAVGYVDSAIKGARRLQGMIDSLLEYSLVGNEDRVAERFRLSDAAAFAIDGLGKAIRDVEATVRHESSECTVVGHLDQIAQVFQNLVSNAIKFSDGRAPDVSVTYRDALGSEIERGARADRRYCLATVRDNGIGIEEKNLEEIFAVFKRLHARSEYEGTGIGLAFCQKVVTSHGGVIWGESAVGEGSSFHVALPLAETETDPA